jgi:hypothetical protein
MGKKANSSYWPDRVDELNMNLVMTSGIFLTTAQVAFLVRIHMDALTVRTLHQMNSDRRCGELLTA